MTEYLFARQSDVDASSAIAAQTAAEAAQAAAESAAADAAADAVSTAADVVTTAANAAATAADALATAADVVSTNADVVSTNADVVTTGNNVTAAEAAQVGAEDALTAALAASENPALIYEFDSGTTTGNASGEVRFDNADISAGSNMFLHQTDLRGNDQSGFIEQFDDANTTIRGLLYVTEVSTGLQCTLSITGALTDNGTDYTIPYSFIDGATAFTDGNGLHILFVPSRDFELASDTTPQLAGDLDVNGQEILSVSGTDIGLHTDNDLVITLGDAAGSNKISIADSGDVEVASINSDGDLSVTDITASAIGGTDITASGTLQGLDLTITGGTDGIDINPGSDTDTDLITVGVTGAPSFAWDESEGSFDINNADLTIGSDFFFNATDGRFAIGIEEYALTIAAGSVPFRFAVHSDDGEATGEFHAHATGAGILSGPVIFGARSDGSVGSEDIVADTDYLFSIAALGYDGTDYAQGARIDFKVDGTPGAGDMPTRIDFLTSPEGSETPAIGFSLLPTGNLDIAASKDLSFNGDAILSDAAGTMTLSNIDALDATTKATIEAAIDTLANLTSVQGLTISLADAGADAFLGWNDGNSQYENLSAAEAVAIIAADAAEVNTGTSTALAITPDALAGSNYGTAIIPILVFDGATTVTTGNAAGDVFWTVPSILNGWDVVDVQASVFDLNSASAGVTTVVLHNVTSAADITSTGVTIDYDENFAADATIDTNEDDLTTGDIWRIDVDTVPSDTSGADPLGLLVNVYVRLP